MHARKMEEIKEILTDEQFEEMQNIHAEHMKERKMRKAENRMQRLNK